MRNGGHVNLGILSSRIHVLWSLTTGSRLGVGDDPVYVKTRCFDPFPFPSDVSANLRTRIGAEAEALDALRKRVLDAHPDLTLTKLYNVRDALDAGRALTEDERAIHDHGLVSLLKKHHDTIDALVAQAYGWPENLTDDEILSRLVALNKERAAEEAKGLVRWLRPDYQAPDYQRPISQSLALEDTSGLATGQLLPWPKSLPEQVTAVRALLVSATTPLSAQDVARAFQGKRPATLRPLLETLALNGLARRLSGDRFAA
jgi:hypothetical protein